MAAELREDSLVRDEILYLPVDVIDPDPEQPRLQVDAELADSIAQHGVLQPIQVRPHPDVADRWLIVDGERRWKGAVAAKVKTIPAQITLEVEDVGDRLVRQIVRNEGKPLTPVEEAKAFKRIIDERRGAGDKHYGVTQLAKELGKPKSTVSDRVALAEIPKPFEKLFQSGELTAAAAPIVRQYSAVPEKILVEALKEVRDDYQWKDSIAQGAPVPLDVLREALDEALTSPWAGSLLVLTADMAKEYKGDVVIIRGDKYAVDREQAKQIREKLDKARSSSARRDSSASDEKWRREAEERQRKEREALKKKQALRSAQFAALNAQLPGHLDGPWLLFIVKHVLGEMQQHSSQLACKLLGLEAVRTKSEWGSHLDYTKPILAHAETLDFDGRVRLVLQLLLAPDVHANQYETSPAKRFQDAAKLLGIDLAAVKPGKPLIEVLGDAPDPAVRKPTPRRRKNAVDEEALNAEATGEELDEVADPLGADDGLRGDDSLWDADDDDLDEEQLEDEPQPAHAGAED